MVVLAAGGFVWWTVSAAPPHTTEDLRIAVGTDEPAELDARLFIPDRVPAPAVLLAHGFGGTKESMTESAEDLVAQGYVVLTYTARGFGSSGGLIHLNAPQYEVADASELLDYLAERDEVSQDAPGDPRVAAVGGSYGGALSLLLAGYDDRVDAIVSQITWHSLAESLFPNYSDQADPAAYDGVFKVGVGGCVLRDRSGSVGNDGPRPR